MATSNRPDLTNLTSDASAFGVIWEDSFGTDRDWEGPFSSEAEATAALAKKSFRPENGQVVPWNARRVALAKVMDEHEIHPNQDYDFAELIEILAGERDLPRYGAIRADETYTIINLHETPQEAADDLAASVSNEYLNQPVGVLDLDTGELAAPRVSVSVDF